MNRTGYLMLSGLLWWLALTAAHGQTSAWLDFSGQIKGESADGSHPGWITIQGFGLGTQLQSGHRGSFSLTKQVDRASPPLFLACAVGTHYPGANLDLNSTPDNTRLARLELVDVSIVADLTASTATGHDHADIKRCGASGWDICPVCCYRRICNCRSSRA